LNNIFDFLTLALLLVENWHVVAGMQDISTVAVQLLMPTAKLIRLKCKLHWCPILFRSNLESHFDTLS